MSTFLDASFPEGRRGYGYDHREVRATVRFVHHIMRVRVSFRQGGTVTDSNTSTLEEEGKGGVAGLVTATEVGVMEIEDLVVTIATEVGVMEIEDLVVTIATEVGVMEIEDFVVAIATEVGVMDFVVAIATEVVVMVAIATEVGVMDLQTPVHMEDQEAVMEIEDPRALNLPHPKNLRKNYKQCIQ